MVWENGLDLKKNVSRLGKLFPGGGTTGKSPAPASVPNETEDRKSIESESREDIGLGEKERLE